MTEHPILFSGAMVRALLDGTKTQTRRLVDHKGLTRPDSIAHIDGALWSAQRSTQGPELIRCRYGVAGDRLWVKETWAAGACADGLSPSQLDPHFWKNYNGGLWYPADDAKPLHPVTPRGKTRVSIHMVRWASRISLDVESIRIEQLEDITEEDARAEGVKLTPCAHPDCGHGDGRCAADSYRGAYALLWNQINGERATWGSRPWVWVISFPSPGVPKSAWRGSR